jgi:hypothetical protein
MGKKKQRSSGEPELGDVGDCFTEIARCNSRIDSQKREHAAWLAQHPDGDWPGAVATVGYWTERRIKAEAKLKAFTSSHS